MNEPTISARDYRAALTRLREGLSEDLATSGLVVDGVIQRFELTFELGWKLLKAMLWREGIDCRSPRACVKEAFQQGIIADGHGWIAMLDDRNKTSHLYDQREALAIYRAVAATYVVLFQQLDEASRSGRFAVP